MVVPPALLLIVALMVIVTPAPLATLPFQVTVFAPVLATAVPPLALAETSVSPAGRISVNSLPELSSCAKVLLFVRATVYVIEPLGAKLPFTVFVPVNADGEGKKLLMLSKLRPTPVADPVRPSSEPGPPNVMA